MDTRSGLIQNITEEEWEIKLGEYFIPVDMDDGTPKQRKEMRVSLNDHRSVLGEQLTKERAERGMTQNALRKLRRQGKLS